MKSKTWIEICKYLKKRLNKNYKIVVDVAAGYGDFINHFTTNAKKIAFDANPALADYTNSDVITYIDSVDNLKNYFKENSVSLFFQSNFLEHISKEQIIQLLKDEYECLARGGEVCILTPNIKYVGGKYWDFFDHITPITEKSLIEEAKTIGYDVMFCEKKFLPYTTKSALPQSRWIVRLYLNLMPLSGFFFGQQSLLILRKK